MAQSIIEFFRGITGNDYLTLFLISMVPVVELRGAIMFMPAMFDSVSQMIAGAFCCLAGSSAVVLPLLFLVKPLIALLKKSRWFERLAARLELHLKDKAKTAENKGKNLKKSEDFRQFFGLFAFVAVPLPLTGAWTGSCIGGFLDLPIYKTAFAIFLGNLTVSILLTAATCLVPAKYVDVLLYAFAALVLTVFLCAVLGKMRKKKRINKN